MSAQLSEESAINGFSKKKWLKIVNGVFWARRNRGVTKDTFWQRCTLHFLGDRMNDKAKDIIGKFKNIFCIYLFQIDKFIIA
jgi:hypothetical protein